MAAFHCKYLKVSECSHDFLQFLKASVAESLNTGNGLNDQV